jgi:methyl acetate hydrolase
MNDLEFVAALDAAQLSGAVALIAGAEGVRYARAFGARDLASAAPMEIDSLVQIASMTKAIVSVAALQLVEKGRLPLDAPLTTLLPDMAALPVIEGFDDAGLAQLRAPKRPITLRHLLTHTSGLGYTFINARLVQALDPANPPVHGTRAALCLPLLFDPGDNWEYGVSTDWVGLAVEAASGQKLDAYIKDHICGPLGMDDTIFHPDAAQRLRAASLYMRTGGGPLAPMPLDIGGGSEAEVLSGGGGLWSTAGDYAKFLQMILGKGRLGDVRILSELSIQMMTENQIGDLRAGAMATVNPAFALPYDPFPDQQSGWSLGFLINPETGPNGRSPGSLAWAGVANCYYWVDPARDVIGIFLTQLLPFGDPAVLAAVGAFEQMAYS